VIDELSKYKLRSVCAVTRIRTAALSATIFVAKCSSRWLIIKNLVTGKKISKMFFKVVNNKKLGDWQENELPELTRANITDLTVVI